MNAFRRSRRGSILTMGAASALLVLGACSSNSGSGDTSGDSGSSDTATKTLVFSPLSLAPPALKGLSEGVKGYGGSKGWDVVVQGQGETVFLDI